jgi:hypothetical protein
MKWYTVIGRKEWDTEDSLLSIQAASADAAKAQFERWLLNRPEDDDGEEDEDDRIVYINYVIETVDQPNVLEYA